MQLNGIKMYTIERLLRDIEEQETALFIGAGASRCDLMPQHQLPDGNEMKLELYKYRYGLISEPNITNYERLFKEEFDKKGYIPPELVWGECLAEKGEKLTPYIKLLDNMFGKKKYIPPNYKFMAWLNLMDERKINQIITTNFDEKIDKAYELLQSRGLFNKITVFSAVDDDDFIKLAEKSKNTRTIYKLHGTISKPFTIRSSLADMNRDLTSPKFEVLKRIFESNGLVIFVGYACNDNDVFNALKKISKEKCMVDGKIVWIKRNPNIKSNTNIFRILSAFNSENNILQLKSYDFFKKFFDKFVDRDQIVMPHMEQHKNFLTEIVIKDNKDIVENKLKKPIPDVLYGEIEYPREFRNELFKIINSFDIQRLRDIKQLSFAQYMYPGATHTRFSHSLGVAYLVSRALNNSNLKKTDDEDKKNTIFSALLHDVGHGPLGHVLDKFYDRLEKGNEHEEFTRNFINDGLIDLKEVLKDVNMNLTEVKDRTVFKSKNIEELLKCADKLYLAWLITDYALDLDRIDFLMRDLLMTSYKCQLKLPTRKQQIFFDKRCHHEDLNNIVDDFISCLCFGSIDDLDESCKDKFPENAQILYLDNKGNYRLEELLAFLLGLYVEMYSNVYYNDRISGAEAMMARALHIAYDAGDIDRSRLYTFTDSELVAYLVNLENDLIREIVYSVKHRRIFRPVVQFNLDMKKNISAVSIEKEIEEQFNLDQNEFRSLVIVNIPRKKELRNLFIKKNDKIVPYPDMHSFQEKLNKNIKAKIFIHPKNKLHNAKERQRLLDLLVEMDLYAEVSSKPAKDQQIKTGPSLDMWVE